jgi:predicted transcriptional regulator
MVLTRSEMEIMDVLWEDGGELSRGDFLARSSEKTWKDSSVHILLNGLLRKGAIREAGVVRRSKTFGRTFLPTMTREEYFAQASFSHRYKPDMVGLVAALLKRPEATGDALQSIKALVDSLAEPNN